MRVGSSRHGLTLIEVLLAMVITAMVLAALTQLQDSGARAALRGSLIAEAALICQSEMDAWLAGNRSAVRLDAIEPVGQSPGWFRRLSLQKLPGDRNLSVLTVDIYRGRQSAPQFTLTRWVEIAQPGGSP